MRWIIVFLLFALSSCAKEEFDPIFNDYTLVGLWVSADASQTLDIKNVKGDGDLLRYIEVYENGYRYLREIRSGIPTTWTVERITPDELHLRDIRSGVVIRYWRAN